MQSTCPSGLTGTGITVGILSDSYDCFAAYASSGVAATGNAGYASSGFTATAADDITSADLPAATSISILKEGDCANYGAPTYLPFADEGRAMVDAVPRVRS